MEYQVDVTVDRNGNSRSLQRVQQNEVEIRDPSQSYQMLPERSMQHGLNGNRRYRVLAQNQVKGYLDVFSTDAKKVSKQAFFWIFRKKLKAKKTQANFRKTHANHSNQTIFIIGDV